MLLRALPVAAALIFIGEVLGATRVVRRSPSEWSAPLIHNPLIYKNLSVNHEQTRRGLSLERRLIWGDAGQLVSRQSTCNPGYALCPSGDYCHQTGSYCCSADEVQSCPVGQTCCSEPGNQANVTGCASAGATCCGSGQCDAGTECCSDSTGYGCRKAGNICCGAASQCTTAQDCCGTACKPKDGTCCSTDFFCQANSKCCSADDGEAYCSPVCCGKNVSCGVGDKCCVDKKGKKFCAESCDKEDPGSTIVPIPTPTPTPDGGSSGLSTGAIAGIAAGVSALGLLVLALIILRCVYHRRHNKPAPAPTTYSNVGGGGNMGQVLPHDPLGGAGVAGAGAGAFGAAAAAHLVHSPSQHSQHLSHYGPPDQPHGIPVAEVASPHHVQYAAGPGAPYNPYDQASNRPQSLHTQGTQYLQYQPAVVPSHSGTSSAGRPSPPQSPVSEYSSGRPLVTPGTSGPPSTAGWQPQPQHQHSGSTSAAQWAAGVAAAHGGPVVDKAQRETLQATPVNRPQESAWGPSGGAPSTPQNGLGLGMMSPTPGSHELPPPTYEMSANR